MPVPVCHSICRAQDPAQQSYQNTLYFYNSIQRPCSIQGLYYKNRLRKISCTAPFLFVLSTSRTRITADDIYPPVLYPASASRSYILLRWVAFYRLYPRDLQW